MDFSNWWQNTEQARIHAVLQGQAMGVFSPVRLDRYYRRILRASRANLLPAIVTTKASRLKLNNLPADLPALAQRIHWEVCAYGQTLVVHTRNNSLEQHPGWKLWYDTDNDCVWERIDADHAAAWYEKYSQTCTVSVDNEPRATGKPQPHGALYYFSINSSPLHDLIPLQQAINYVSAAQLIGVDRVASPLWYMLGQSGSLTPGQVNLNPSTTNVLQLVADQVGAFPSPDLGALSSLRRELEYELCSVAGVPAPLVLSYAQDTHSSGVSLQQRTQRLIAELEDTQRRLEPTWTDLIGEMPQWASLYTLTPDEQLDRAERFKALGLAPSVWLRELGLPDDTPVIDPDLNDLSRAFLSGNARADR